MTELMTQTRPTMGGDVVAAGRLSSEELRRIDAYWRACTYLAAGMIYLRAERIQAISSEVYCRRSGFPT